MFLLRRRLLACRRAPRQRRLFARRARPRRGDRPVAGRSASPFPVRPRPASPAVEHLVLGAPATVGMDSTLPAAARQHHPRRDRRGRRARCGGGRGTVRPPRAPPGLRPARLRARRARGGRRHDLRPRVAHQGDRHHHGGDDPRGSRAGSISRGRYATTSPSSTPPTRRRSPCRCCSRTRAGSRRTRPCTGRRAAAPTTSHEINARPLVSAPGSQVLYSDWDMVLLQAVIERIAGMSLDNYVDGHVFRPLGMVDTRFAPGHHRPLATAAHRAHHLRRAARRAAAGHRARRERLGHRRRVGPRRAVLHRARHRRLRADAARRRHLQLRAHPLRADDRPLDVAAGDWERAAPSAGTCRRRAPAPAATSRRAASATPASPAPRSGSTPSAGCSWCC